MTMSSARTWICVLPSAGVMLGIGGRLQSMGQMQCIAPISFFLYLSSALATLKSSFKIDFLWAFFGPFVANHDETKSMVLFSNRAVSTPTRRISGCCLSRGSVTNDRMWVRRTIRSRLVLD